VRKRGKVGWWRKKSPLFIFSSFSFFFSLLLCNFFLSHFKKVRQKSCRITIKILTADRSSSIFRFKIENFDFNSDFFFFFFSEKNLLDEASPRRNSFAAEEDYRERGQPGRDGGSQGTHI